MGTQVSVLLPKNHAAIGAAGVRALFERWEQALSRFRPESELAYVNTSAGQPVIVSPLFMHVLEAALEAARATGGIYDPTLLQQIVDAGYDRTFTALPEDAPPPPAPAGPGGAWRFVRLDRRLGTVTLPSGAGLDFGGIAKGMAVDAALEDLVALGVPCAAVEAGGDLRVHGLPPGETGWPIAVEARDGHETVSLHAGALTTSSVARRRWKRGGREMHHLLDPRSGEPVENGVWSVTVAAARCDRAEVAAKTALILGPEAGTAFLARHGLAALMVLASGERLRVGAWPGSPREDAA